MIVYQLGDIKFTPNNMPSDWTLEEGMNYAEMDRLQGLPTLQQVGGVLAKLEWEIHMHLMNTGGNIREAVEALTGLMYSAEAKPLINGVGSKVADFVITKAITRVNKTDGKGRYLDVSMSISLLQFVSGEEKDDEEIKARRAALATIEANPITVTPTVKYQTPQAMVMRDIVTTTASAGTAASAAKKAADVPALAKKYVREMNGALTTGKAALTTARAGVDAVAGKISNAVALKSSMDGVLATINSMLSAGAVDSPNLGTLNNLSTTLESGMDVLMSTASQLALVTILRK